MTDRVEDPQVNSGLMRMYKGSESRRPYLDLTDEECIQLALSGQDQGRGLEEIFRRYGKKMFNLLVRILCDQEEAKDLAQEVFLKVQLHLKDFDSKRNFRSWIYTICWNLARDQLRKRSRRSKTISLNAESSQAEFFSNRDLVDTAGVTPSQVCELNERDDFIRCALARISPTQRALLILREYEGLSYEEIATLSGVRLGTVKSRLNRARLEFKDRLQELNPKLFN